MTRVFPQSSRALLVLALGLSLILSLLTMVVPAAARAESPAEEPLDAVDVAADLCLDYQAYDRYSCLSWQVEDQAGEPRSDVEFNVEVTYAGWSDAFGETISDCVGEECARTMAECDDWSCAGSDLDPDPGRYLVLLPQLVLGHPYIYSENYLYRVKAINNPSAPTFVAPLVNLGEMPDDGTGRPADGVWEQAPYLFDFGLFRLRDRVPSCEAGFVYGVSARGNLLERDPDGVVTVISDPIPEGELQAGMNGLAISSAPNTANSGTPIGVYAFQQVTETGFGITPQLFQFNPNNGQWEDTGIQVRPTHPTNMVAASGTSNPAVLYLGGFSADQPRFYVIRVDLSDPENPVSSEVGYIDTSFSYQPETQGGSGDLDVDAFGNLYLLHGEANQAVLYTVPVNRIPTDGENHDTELMATHTEKVMDPFGAGASDPANGLAFDNSGSIFVGTTDRVELFDMPAMDNRREVTNLFSDSSDLASCGYPPTFTLIKDLPNGRVHDTDQFTLSLYQGDGSGPDDILIASATTKGTDPGIQQVQLGPVPVNISKQMTILETEAGTAEAENYQSNWKCLGDNETEPFAYASGTTGTGIFEGYSHIVCTFINTPLVAQVNVKVLTRDEDGNDTPAAGWTVESQIDAIPPGSATMHPGGSQDTNEDGVANWEVQFNQSDSQANVTVAETSPLLDGEYQFVEGSCQKTNINGVPGQVQSLTGPTDQLVDDPLLVGETLDCTFVNEQQPRAVTWSKVDAADEDMLLAGSEWTLTSEDDGSVIEVTDCAAPGCPGPDLDPVAGQFRLEGLNPGSYQLAETVAPDWYQLNDEGYSITVGSSEPSSNYDLGKIPNTRIPPTGPDLPLTGGVGADRFILLGLVLIGGSAGAMFLWRRLRS